MRLVFFITGPATDSTQYLLLISSLARLAKDSQFVEKLHAAHDTFQMLEALQQIKLPSGQRNDTLKKLGATGAK